jgi:hypothetical protein
MTDARVVLRLFSGLPNPTWTLPRKTVEKITLALQSLPLQPETFRPELIRGPLSDPLGRPRSGYRGFRIFKNSQAQVADYEIYNSLVLEVATGRIRTGGTHLDEEIVWRTIPPAVLEEELDNLPFATMSAPGDLLQPISGVLGPYVALDCTHSPAYDKTGGDFNLLKAENNCYNYATLVPNLIPLSDPALPGQKNSKRKYLTARLRQALEEDKLEFEGFIQPTTCPDEGEHRIVAMIRRVASGRLKDFHFLRLDNSGRWSHKDGDGSVTNQDDDDHLIGDLTQARFQHFPELAGFFLAKKRFRKWIN